MLLEPSRPLRGHGGSVVPALEMGWEPVALRHGQTMLLGCPYPSWRVLGSWGLECFPSMVGMLQAGPVPWGLVCTPLGTCPAPQQGPAWSPRPKLGPPPAMQGSSSLRLPLLSWALGHDPGWLIPALLWVGAAVGTPPGWGVGVYPLHPPLSGSFPCSQGCGCTCRSTAEPPACPRMLPGH